MLFCLLTDFKVIFEKNFVNLHSFLKAIKTMKAMKTIKTTPNRRIVAYQKSKKYIAEKFYLPKYKEYICLPT